MSLYRRHLPQLDPATLFLTDGGLETTLIYHEGRTLPAFAAFPLLDTPDGVRSLRGYYERYLDLAARHDTGFILESPTWRANADWGAHVGYGPEALAAVNRRAIAELETLRRAAAERLTGPVVVSGCIGPRGDGYVAERQMSIADAEAYHAVQIGTFADTSADMVTAMTMNYTEEAIGIAQAARRVGLPCAIAFTVETDGRLPSGEPLRAALERVDAVTGAYPAYYLLNCAHPAHFAPVLQALGPVARRLQGLRVNASHRSHAELDAATELDAGDPEALAWAHVSLLVDLPRLNVLGGCCGTDHRHIDAIAGTCRALFRHGPPAKSARRSTWVAGAAMVSLAGLAGTLLARALERAPWA
ncbi:MAG: homocysteine S-methyltransferase family protein [Gammaproteobacteria bacterium]